MSMEGVQHWSGFNSIGSLLMMLRNNYGGDGGSVSPEEEGFYGDFR